LDPQLIQQRTVIDAMQDRLEALKREIVAASFAPGRGQRCVQKYHGPTPNFCLIGRKLYRNSMVRL
jgi:hypothetical protein